MVGWRTGTARNPIKKKERSMEETLWSFTSFQYNLTVTPVALTQPEDSHQRKFKDVVRKAWSPRAEYGREGQKVDWSEANTKLTQLVI